MRVPVLSATVLVGLAGMSHAQTIAVTTRFDVFDITAPYRMAQLPGPDGEVSLREALAVSDATPGPQTIRFAIPRATWDEVFYPGRAMLDMQGPVVVGGDDTTLDFGSQRDLTGDTNPGGNVVGMSYSGPPNGASFIYVQGHRNIVRGLDLTGGNAFGDSVFISGNDNIVEGCRSTSVQISGNFSGPSAVRNIIRNNTLGEVSITCWSNDNIVVGNRLRHLLVAGSQFCVHPTGNRIGGPTPQERNVISGHGYYGEEGFPTGTQLEIVWARGTIVEGNYVGTTSDGMAREPQIGPTGIGITDSFDTTIRGNLVAGLRTQGARHYQGVIFGDAIAVNSVNATTERVTITNNSIGLAADGVTVIPTLRGINVSPMTALQSSATVVIGGRGAGESNTIAGVEAQGVFVASLEGGVRISGNSIHDCGGVGIELIPSSGADGPTPNDPGDTDTGSNALQNYPVLQTARVVSGGLRVTGTLDTLASQAFGVEFFGSPSCDATGFGEGAVFLGWTVVTTDATGHASFDVVVPALHTVPGWSATATAVREQNGDTSEYSACVALSGAVSCPADLDDGSGTGTPDLGVTIDDLLYFLAQFEGGNIGADLDDGSGTGTPDGGVTIDDLVYFLSRFAAGC